MNTSVQVQFFTNDFDVDGSTSSSQFVLQSHFVLSCISMKTAVHLQMTGSILLPVGQVWTQDDQIITENLFSRKMFRNVKDNL